MPRFRSSCFLLCQLLAISLTADLAEQEYLGKFQLVAAPPLPPKPIIHRGDRLAICGDSITEQKLYSRIIETYLTVCTPELNLDIRQYGWSGETAEGFLHRMTNDVLRFNPSVATTCYGMNDHRYVPFKPEIGEHYRQTMSGVVESFQSHGVRVVLGSPGCVGKMPSWVKSATGTVFDLNANLCQLRNIDIELSRSLHTASFADVFSPMLTAEYEAHLYYGPDYAVPGKDGVHPGLAGQAIMAYSFLRGLGVDGDIGTIIFNAGKGRASGTPGHKIISTSATSVMVESSRFPFCAPGSSATDDSIRSGFQWVPFQAQLNRFKLVVQGASSPSYQVTWGPVSKIYSAEQLKAGINLTEEFAMTPFDDAFARVDQAVAAKQAYETQQIKGEFHGEAGRKDMEATARTTEATRAPIAAAVKAAFAPVRHELVIEPITKQL